MNGTNSTIKFICRSCSWDPACMYSFSECVFLSSFFFFFFFVCQRLHSKLVHFGQPFVKHHPGFCLQHQLCSLRHWASLTISDFSHRRPIYEKAVLPVWPTWNKLTLSRRQANPHIHQHYYFQTTFWHRLPLLVHFLLAIWLGKCLGNLCRNFVWKRWCWCTRGLGRR